jgi:CheY-like chemotaxis protein
VVPPKVLVADTSRIVRATVARHLAPRFEVRQEQTGDAAWQALLTDPQITGLVTGTSLTGISGFELIDKARTSLIPRLNNMPILLLAGGDLSTIELRASALGADGVVPKDMRAAEALRKLDVLVEQTRGGFGSTVHSLNDEDAEPTGFAARAGLEAYLAELAAKTPWNNEPYCVLAIQMSDDAHEQRGIMAANLNAVVRGNDRAAQLTEHIFLVVLANADRAAANKLVARLHTMLNEALGHDLPFWTGIAENSGGLLPEQLIELACEHLQPYVPAHAPDWMSEPDPLPSLDEVLMRVVERDTAQIEPLRAALRAHAKPLLDWLQTDQ